MPPQALRAKRPAAAEALKHRFVASAPATGRAAGSGGKKEEQAQAPAPKKKGWLPWG